ncbi:MAG: OmpA family protein [Spirochaetia bacterium]|nr:OmpA family protein [Spirochaetia bacterium]
MKSFIKSRGVRSSCFKAFLVLFIFSVVPLKAQQLVFSPSQAGVYKKRTVFNLRIKENNLYKGSVYREIREKYSLVSEEKSVKIFSGISWIFEELKNEGRDKARKVDHTIDGSFSLSPDGSIKRAEGSSFPFLTGFPVYPSGSSVKQGQLWTSTGDMLVDPLKKGIYTKVEFICQYKYDGITRFKGLDVYQVSAQFAIRYKKGDDFEGDKELLDISGSHKAVIYLTAEEGLPYFIQDNIDETYRYAGLTYSQKGFSHTWYSDVIPMKKDAVKEEITLALKESGLEGDGYSVEEKGDGVSLTVNKLHFVPDSAELLPGEEDKIKTIAGVLLKIPERTFLVTGHTADVGTAQSQLELSVKRAQKIAQMLAMNGIAPDKLIFTGKGGTEPASGNSSEEGRAKNRRVEIIILED